MDIYKCLWRYSVNEGEHGGIVYADTEESAREKVRVACNKWGHDIEELVVWKIADDDFFDIEHKDVFDCYGIWAEDLIMLLICLIA